ncbi:twin-arginine translocation signal domain-containing protein [Collinsella sp. AGMB00827]|uniref:Twin-arginine translocation signal domain-containing protein n=1 Tax=Collinsella ureilytica TaxID=2869515 RepID=A0ABS7MJW0_9ACTN|nr:twin-arginine translocation signal domain-containing protein [Collinsella urealyticum]MBY4797658.1 twin-arginine translocation signal domain-containing protein [Collinsella urealyticum]
MSMNLTRRNFLRGTIAVGAGVLGAGTLAGCSKNDAKAPAAAGSGAKGASGKVVLHRGYGSAHGDKAFTQVVVAVKEDGTIAAVNIDEYQFVAADTEGITPVPNSDEKLAKCYAEGQVLISKADNNEFYSKLMAEHAKATKGYLESMKAVEAFAVGKKASELKDVDVDAISGSTLVDGPNYLAVVAEVAADDTLTSTGELAEGEAKFGRVVEAIHSKMAFGSAVSLVQGDTLVATSIDEFQFFDAKTEGVKPVPNSDKGFGAGYAEGQVLVSKGTNDSIYSALMKEHGKATKGYLESLHALEDDIAGKKLDDLADVDVDAISGSTLVDGGNYIAAAQHAGKLA